MSGTGFMVERAAQQDVVALAKQQNLMKVFTGEPDATLLAIRGFLSQKPADAIESAAFSDFGGMNAAEAIDIIDRSVDRREFKLETEIDLMRYDPPQEQVQLVSAFERFFGLYQRTDEPPFTRTFFVPVFDYRITGPVDQAVEVDVTFLSETTRSAEAKLTLRDVGFVRSSAHSASVKQDYFKRMQTFQLTVPVKLEFFQYRGPMVHDLRYTARVHSVGEVYFVRPAETDRYTRVDPLEPPVSLFPFMELGGGKDENKRVDVIEKSEGFKATASYAFGDNTTLALDYKTSMQQAVTATYRKLQPGDLYAAAWPAKSRFKGMTWITDSAPNS